MKRLGASVSPKKKPAPQTSDDESDGHGSAVALRTPRKTAVAPATSSPAKSSLRSSKRGKPVEDDVEEEGILSIEFIEGGGDSGTPAKRKEVSVPVLKLKRATAEAADTSKKESKRDSDSFEFESDATEEVKEDYQPQKRTASTSVRRTRRAKFSQGAEAVSDDEDDEDFTPSAKKQNTIPVIAANQVKRGGRSSQSTSINKRGGTSSQSASIRKRARRDVTPGNEDKGESDTSSNLVPRKSPRVKDAPNYREKEVVPVENGKGKYKGRARDGKDSDKSSTDVVSDFASESESSDESVRKKRPVKPRQISQSMSRLARLSVSNELDDYIKKLTALEKETALGIPPSKYTRDVAAKVRH